MVEENENTTNEIDTTEQVPGTVLTKKGIRLIAKILGSETVLKITRAAVGTGTIPEGVEAREMEDLSCFKKDGKISRVGKVDGENQVNIAIQVNSIGVDENFVITEAGIFAEDPDEGEILYCYLDMTEDPQLVYHSRNAISKMVEITMAIKSCSCPDIFPPVRFKNRILTNAPIIIMPSSAIFTTPLRSENIPPSATIIRGMVKSIVC